MVASLPPQCGHSWPNTMRWLPWAGQTVEWLVGGWAPAESPGPSELPVGCCSCSQACLASCGVVVNRPSQSLLVWWWWDGARVKSASPGGVGGRKQNSLRAARGKAAGAGSTWVLGTERGGGHLQGITGSSCGDAPPKTLAGQGSGLVWECVLPGNPEPQTTA